MNGTDQNWTQFLDRLAHDMREPLRSIHTFGELLREGSKERLDADCGRFLEEILGSSERLSSLVDGISQYALALDERDGSEASLQLAFDAAAASLDNEIQATGAKVTRDDLPRLGVKLERQIQLLENLIRNSLRFRREASPIIHVSAEPSEDSSSDFWTIRVTDNGIGIPREECETVFRPFMKVHGRRYPGAGLGLAICRRIVENHGGKIHVEPGARVGTVCTFTLPSAEG